MTADLQGRDDEWREKRKNLGRKVLSRAKARQLKWPSESPANRQMFDLWYRTALQQAHAVGVSVETLAAFPLVVWFKTGTVTATNIELAIEAGGISDRSVKRHLQLYGALGIITFDRGWKVSDKTRKMIETRTIVLSLPERYQLEGDTGGPSGRENHRDTGGPSNDDFEDTGGPGFESRLKDTGGPTFGDTGGPSISSVTSDAADVSANRPTSGGRPTDRPAAVSALPATSESMPSSQSRSEAHYIAGPAGAGRHDRPEDQRPANPYLAAKEGWE